jgi:hypothetical protein
MEKKLLHKFYIWFNKNAQAILNEFQTTYNYDSSENI